MPRAYGYLRVSTDRQVTDQQRDAISRHYEVRLKSAGYEWGHGVGIPHHDGWFEDLAVSGKLPLLSRTAGSRLLTDLAPGDVLVVSKLDRAFRDTVDCLTTMQIFAQTGIKLHVLNFFGSGDMDLSSPMGELMLTIAAAFASWERRTIGERVRESVAARKLRGLPVGGRPPYPFKLIGRRGRRKFVLCHHTRACGQQFVAWKQEGWSLHAIWSHCVRHGLRTRKQQEWSIKGIRLAIQGELQLRALEAERSAEA